MKKIITLCLVINFFFDSYGQYKYPVTKTVDQTDTYFGVNYKDPYRWLESIDQPEVETWFKQQADYSNTILNKINGRDELIAEWKKLDKLQPPRISSIIYENGRIFYRKTMPGENKGTVIVSCEVVENAGFYEFAYTEAPFHSNSTWISKTSTKRKAGIDGLLSGKQYAIKGAGAGSDPARIWSDEILSFVL
jgi:hypothetical protein